MSEVKHTHPIFDKQEEQSLQEMALTNTNADFPVRNLIEAETDVIRPKEEPKKEKGHKKEVSGGKSVTKISGQEDEPEMLSSFTQWLMSLKPTSFGDAETIPEVSPPVTVTEDIPVEKAKKKKKKNKKKKKKKEAKLKARAESLNLPGGSDLVSDTLAELIAGQGHKDEAISMFRKLVDLHPEKAAFYLRRITELQQSKD
jgi:hypothetical protein